MAKKKKKGTKKGNPKPKMAPAISTVDVSGVEESIIKQPSIATVEEEKSQQSKGITEETT